MLFVSPKQAGNVGSLARAMANFGFSKLIVVKPLCNTFADDAYKRAMHAVKVLEKTEVFDSIEEAVQKSNIDFLVATSAISTKSEKNYLRIAKSPAEFAELIKKYEGTVGILFGREDFGLLREEIAMSDLLVTIPASTKYPVLNVSHAAAIIFYELWLTNYTPYRATAARKLEKEKLFEFFSDILDAINYPTHKKENTKIMFRRLIGRAVLTKWEYHILMGVFSRCVKKLTK